MTILNMAGRFCVLVAASLICLSGCGGGVGSSSAGNSSTTVAPVQTPVSIPGTPSNVSAVGGTNKTTISWAAVSSATSYNIYWATAANVSITTGTRIASAGNLYIHRGLLPAASYYYVVTAQNSSGESAASGQVSAVTAVLDGTVPYTTYCASCHGYLATSTVTNASNTEIRAALQTINNMSALTLTDSQIATISAALMYNN
jgi:hypothetical protein